MKPFMQEKIEEFIKYRKNLGNIVGRVETYLLRSFGRFADETSPGKPLSVKLAVRWAVHPGKSGGYHIHRLDLLRPLARYLIVDHPKTELIPTRILGQVNARPIPYVFSQAETIQLMKALPFSRPFNPSEKFFNQTFTTFIGLLACSGLRVGEAMALCVSDIDWKNKMIMVRSSKKLPTRLVPLTDSSIQALRRYENHRQTAFPDTTNEYFFLSRAGRRLLNAGVNLHWKRIRDGLKIGGLNGKKPRMYDFRHTFACNVLLQAYRNGQDIDNAVRILSRYLGHANIDNTYWYLSAVPELMELSGRRFENHILKMQEEDKQ